MIITMNHWMHDQSFNFFQDFLRNVSNVFKIWIWPLQAISLQVIIRYHQNKKKPTIMAEVWQIGRMCLADAKILGDNGCNWWVWQSTLYFSLESQQFPFSASQTKVSIIKQLFYFALCIIIYIVISNDSSLSTNLPLENEAFKQSPVLHYQYSENWVQPIHENKF